MDINTKKPLVFASISKNLLFLKNRIMEEILNIEGIPIIHYDGNELGYELSRQGSQSLLAKVDELWIFGVIGKENLDDIELAMKHSKLIQFYSFSPETNQFKKVYSCKELVFEDGLFSLEKEKSYRALIQNYLKICRVNDTKWILNEMPKNLTPIAEGKVYQMYFLGNDDIRIRKRECEYNTNYFLDIKGKGDLVMSEITKSITKEEFETLKNMIGRNPIIKEYHYYDIGLENVLEVSIVDSGTDHMFIYAEIEFNNMEEAKKYILPIKDALDVTDDEYHKLKNYWIRTRL